jgi:uncharacterized protein
MSEMDDNQPPPPPGGDQPGDAVNLGKPEEAPVTGEGAQGQPGWYPDPGTGQLRWWDGRVWGAFQSTAPPPVPIGVGSTSDPKNTAALAHYLGAGLLFFTCYLNWLGPLIIFAGPGKTDPFIRDQSAEALNFQLTIFIAAVISGALLFVLIGFVLLPIVYLVGIIFGVMGGLAASRGEWYHYPLAIKFVKAG